MRRPCLRQDGFSLVEVMIAVGVLAVVAAIGMTAMNRVGESSGESKLTADVSSLNAATQMYLASGGDLSGAATPNDVLAKLKTVATAAQTKTMINPMTGSFIDRRLAAEMQTATEAATAAPRVYWNSGSQAWEVKTTGGVGVKRFVLDEALSSVMVQTETRDGGTMEFASTDGWVWDHRNDWGDDSRIAPTGVGTTAFPDPPPPTDGSATAGTSTAGTGSGGSGSGSGGDDGSTPPPLPRLPTPSINPGGGSYPIGDYPMAVSVTNAGVYGGNGTLKYSMNYGAWTVYTGPLMVGTGDRLRIVAFSNDTDTWRNSYTRYGNYYTLQPPRLPQPVLDKTGGPYVSNEYPLTVLVVNAATYAGNGTLKYQMNSGPWLTYATGMSVPPDTTLRVQAFTDDPVAYRDSYQVSEYYYAIASSFSGNTDGEYGDVVGGPNLVYSLSEGNSFLSHGRSTIDIGGELIDAGEANTLKFLSSNFSGIVPGDEFLIGELLYHNGTTFDNSHATGAKLDVELNFTTPSASETITIDLDLINTENTSDPDASADYVKLTNVSEFHYIDVGGQTYVLLMYFGTSDVNGFSTISQFHVYEGATARGEIRGIILPTPGGSGWTLQDLLDFLDSLFGGG